MDDELIVTVTIEDVATAFADGSIIRMTGTTDDGRRVTFAGDHRPMGTLIENLLTDEDESATVALEAWQILSIEEVR